MTIIRRAAVLGAGAMGSGIAAHLANAGVPTLLLDMAPRELTDQEQAKGLDLTKRVVRNRLADQGLEAARKARPAAFGHLGRAALVTTGNFEDDLAKLADCDWVVEAVVERLDVKAELLGRVAAHLSPTGVLSTNTSGLSVTAMSAALPVDLRRRFFGTHFFNPARYMQLLELIPTADTDLGVMEDFAAFAERRLGKGVVRGKDTPNFVANRIGIFSTLYALHALGRHGLGVDDADAVSGRALARSGTATFGTSDLAGIDVLAHAVRTHYEGAPDDEQREVMQLPTWVAALVERGTLGRKAGAGFYSDKGKTVVDPATLEYRPLAKLDAPSLGAALKTGDPVKRVAAFVAADDPAGRFAWDLAATTLLYAAHRLPEIADDIQSVDEGMRWGYAWELGPFELWDALGVPESVERMRAESRDIPAWVAALAESVRPSFYVTDGTSTAAWSPLTLRHEPVRERSWAVSLAALKRRGAVLAEDDSTSLVDLGDRVACIEFHTKANVVSEPVLDFIEQTLERAGHDYDALVIGNEGKMFSAGADLAAMLGRAQRGDWAAIDATLRRAQRVMMAMKYAPVPIVAAPFGQVLGGGLEVVLHCHRVQASFESNLGLVETSVGVLPGAGGNKEMLLRGMEAAGVRRANLPVLRRAFETIAMSKTSTSALDAFDLLYMRPDDGVTMHRDGLLNAAKQAALALLACGWQPLAPVTIEAAGRDGLGNLRMFIHIMHEGGHISDHDALIGDKVASVLCGGEVDAGTLVDEAYLLDIERAAFVDLCREPLTQARMEHVLETGKPLRN